MNHTKIEWVQNPDGTPGYTWNPVTGCLNHINGMCKGGGFPCYAYRLANGRLKHLYLANFNIAPRESIEDTSGDYQDPFYPRFWPEKLLQPIHIGSAGYRPRKAKGIFVCDMSDLFGIGIPEEWTQKVLSSIRVNPDYRFYLLTKQPQNLAKFSPFPDNCWVGVTVTNYKMANEARYWLGKIKAKVKYLSLEPFLKPLRDRLDCLFQFDFQLDWLIVGAQTKPSVFPKIEWVQDIVEACKEAGIPYFLKDNLAPILPDDKLYWKLGYENGHFTEAKPRQEMPK